jgi:hypothetical protein
MHDTAMQSSCPDQQLTAGVLTSCAAGSCSPGSCAGASISGTCRTAALEGAGSSCVQQPFAADVDMTSCSETAGQGASAPEHADSVAGASTSAARSGAKTAAAKKAPDPQKDAGMVPGVETGEDVVAFYGRNGQDSSVKFFYAVRCACGGTVCTSMGAAVDRNCPCRL